MKSFLAVLIAGACLLGLVHIRSQLDRWRLSVFDYHERIKVAAAIRDQIAANAYTNSSMAYRWEVKDDEAMRRRVIDYHRELEKLLQNKPYRVALNGDEQEMLLRVQVALGRYRHGDQRREEESLQTRIRPVGVSTEDKLLVMPPAPTPSPTSSPLLKFITPAPQPTPTREQVLSDIERKYGNPTPRSESR